MGVSNMWTLIHLNVILIFFNIGDGAFSECSDPELCPETWAFQHRPLLRFDRSAEEYCYPDRATNTNNGQCAGFSPEAPVYYKVVRCGDFLKLAWHLWYGLQRGCDPLGVDHGHDDDWEHITINFIRDNQTWVQDSVTFHQHGGHYTRRNQQQNPDVTWARLLTVATTIIVMEAGSGQRHPSAQDSVDTGTTSGMTMRTADGCRRISN